MEYIFVVLQDANVQWVLLGTTMLGLVSGLLSVFMVLRRESLLGDVLAHAALPGVCLAYLLFGVKSIPLFMLGAIASGIFAVLSIQWIVRYTKLRQDAAFAIVLSVFFGAGLVFLTFIQQHQIGEHAGIDRFLFGQAASMVPADILWITASALLVMILLAVLFKEWHLSTFDPQFAFSIGLPVRALNILMMVMITIVVIIGIQIVGVVLMAALLITPSLSARFWTNHFTRLLCLSAAFGALAGVLGTLISALLGDIPTGPLIVIASTLIMIISALFAPQRGWLIRKLRNDHL